MFFPESGSGVEDADADYSIPLRAPPSALQAEQKKKGGAVKNKKLMTAEERDKARDEAGLKPLKRAEKAERNQSRRVSPGIQAHIRNPLEPPLASRRGCPKQPLSEIIRESAGAAKFRL